MEWISVNDRFPKIDQPVWLYENGTIRIGCRTMIGNEWYWASDIFGGYYRNGSWSFDFEVDDLSPDKWMPLPDPPKDLKS